MTSRIREDLAVVVGDCWWRICEEPKDFAHSTPEQKETFRRMAEYALRSARAGRREATDVARAICAAFWLDHPQPWPWETLGQAKRQVFLTVARQVIAAGQAMRRAADEVAA